MIGVTYQQIVEKIKEEKQLTEEDINSKISSKLEQLGDLISKDGAAHIVANELGVKVYENLKKEFKIKDLMPGINSVDLLVKIMNIYGVREFKKEERTGKVASLLVGDETGICRVALWDTNLIKLIEETKLKQDSVVELKNCYVKENNGFKELHLGSRGQIEISDKKLEVKPYSGSNLNLNSNEIKKINELKAGDNVNVKGYIVQLFEPRFYDACPECNKKVMENNGKGHCQEHGEVIPRKNPVLNFYLDDGIGNIRDVGFRDVAEDILEGVKEIADNPEKFNELKDKAIGNKIVARGRVVQNDMFNRKEFMINAVEMFDVKNDIEAALKE